MTRRIHLRAFAIAITIMIMAIAVPTHAGITYVWTNGGVANDLDDPNNWNQASAPASGSKIGTTDATDIIRFNSETATLPTANIDLVRINPAKPPNIELLNGTLNFNRAENWQWGGTTFTIGDGNMTALAQANFTNGTINLNRDAATLTYLINADGTLHLNNQFQIQQDNTTIRLNGGFFDGTGQIVTAGLTNVGSNYFSFEALGSTFTLNYGGQLANATAVTDAFGDSFRLGGSLALDPNASLTFTDNGTSFTIGVSLIPEPASLALLGMGTLLIASRRRRG